MPELPEVETVRRTLKRLVVGKTIRAVDVFLPKMVRNVDPAELSRRLSGTTITDMDRYGKHLMFVLGDLVLVSHLRMEGKYYIKDLDVPRDKHEHVVFYFTDDTTLRYHDTRQFGTFDLYDKETVRTDSSIGTLGPEPHSEDLTTDYLWQAIRHKSQAIKPTLLDQTVIAGLGNIYVDEVLFRAGLHPTTPCKRLRKYDMERIVTACREVIAKAIDLGGTTVRSYTASLGVHGRFQNELMVHTKEGEPCPVCQTTIEKTKVGGRGTYHCPTCQNKRRR
jgi:formamidopyrimidine-DNA glycosylase